jgi:AraC-like DNA-binding protein
MFYQLEHLGTTNYFKKETGENFSFPPHLHQSFELILVNEGEMKVQVDDKSYLLNKGDAVLIFPEQIHSIQSTTSAHTLFIFSPRIIQSFTQEKSECLPINNSFTLTPEFFNTLVSLSENKSKFEIKGALYTVCAIFDNQTEYIPITADKQAVLVKILSFTEQNFNRDCSVLTFSSQMGYNPDYVSRIFKKKMGISYTQYLNARRLNNAVYLLLNTDSSCLSCALESGFASLRTFNRNFKQFFHTTPKEYQQSHRNKTLKQALK